MPDREKVIKGLGEALTLLAEYVPCEGYLGYAPGACLDAIELLKSQEPRVMTLEEAKSAYVIEYRSGKMCEVGAALLDIDVDPLNAEYGKVYRVWTSRPTEAQREAVPWMT